MGHKTDQPARYVWLPYQCHEYFVPKPQHLPDAVLATELNTWPYYDKTPAYRYRPTGCLKYRTNEHGQRVIEEYEYQLEDEDHES